MWLPTVASSPFRTALRVAALLAATAVVYLVLGFFIYLIPYAIVADNVYDVSTGDSFAALEATFYTSYAVHLLSTMVLGVVIARRVGTPTYPAMAMIVLFLALAAHPTLGLLSFDNVCNPDISISFPFSGWSC